MLLHLPLLPCSKLPSDTLWTCKWDCFCGERWLPKMPCVSNQHLQWTLLHQGESRLLLLLLPLFYLSYTPVFSKPINIGINIQLVNTGYYCTNWPTFTDRDAKVEISQTFDWLQINVLNRNLCTRARSLPSISTCAPTETSAMKLFACQTVILVWILTSLIPSHWAASAACAPWTPRIVPSRAWNRISAWHRKSLS